MKEYAGIIIVIMATILFSCTERIEYLPLDSTNKRLVVYGEISTEPGIHYVQLTTTADYFSNEPLPAVSGASVYIYNDSDTVKLTENDSTRGLYQTFDGYRGIAGKTYTLNIDGVDINQDGHPEAYTASSYLPPVNPIDSITLEYSTNLIGSGWNVNVWAWDPAEVKNYYAFKVYRNGVILTDSLTDFIVQSDDLFNGSYTYGITAQYLSDDNAAEKVVAGDTVTFELDGITGDYYRFIQEALAETYGHNPIFSGPPANITGNISNGAIGFFTAYSVARASKIVPDYSSGN